jgi:hypothetical protein
LAVWPLASLDGTPYPTIPAGTSVVNVSTSSQLSSALAAATAGQKIVLANGTYSGDFSMSGKNATASSGISIEAATVGGASFASGSTFRITNCTYVTAWGLLFGFDAAGDVFQFRGTSHHCRLMRSTFGPSTHAASSDVSNWIYVGDDCHTIRIGFNAIRNKGTSGNAVRVYGNFDKVDAGQGSSAGCRWVRIDHNSFKTIKPEVGNDKEPIRYGVSSMSRTIANGVIERNYFEDCLCEPEIISGKMGALRITGNTVYRCAGGIVVRHGTNSVVADNYIIDRVSTTASGGLQSGGIRFYDADHKIANNYVDGTIGSNFQDPLLLDTGDAEGESDPSTGTPTQTLGVGGVATPAGAILTTADSSSTLNITTSGTASNPRVYDGQRHTVKKINIAADYVTVQNFVIRGADNSGVYSIGTGNTIQNCDIAQVTEGGVGDINGVTFFGDQTKILFNSIGQNAMLVSGSLNGSHTDGIQTWNTPSKRSSSNVTIKGNYITGPTQSDERYIHQGVMSEGRNSTDGGGGGTGMSQNWLVEANYFKTYGNQCLKFDDIHNVTITKNTFAGSCTKIVAKGSLSTGITFASDNTITGSYGSTVGD